MPIRPIAISFFLILGLAASQTQSAQTFWSDFIKRPLSSTNADKVYADSYKDAVLPTGLAPYLEGHVVSVARSPASQEVLLSMESNGVADAKLLLDGHRWKLNNPPIKGAVVRFTGVIRKFTREPFMISFEPEQISGLDVTTTAPNLPLRVR